ncbi:ImmA/IrrE family metallo-endopeptidase [Membranihabitans maritimus]|uniref:ImmA/IrrE family metallo-endopeptidase n=1 Tax=Membranihabitans maritimus TaxID=2904244 RepID=UPI001F2D6D56|nr:ImmA/IrrE family metallo-endopeptidase [Membranihabitans maritimus]
MNKNRKSEIAGVAKHYSRNIQQSVQVTDLVAIAKSEDIGLIFDHYNGSFEGLTVCDKGNFFIHIDTDSTKDIHSGRTRFTIAHELGHALIDEHRIGLLSGAIEPHISIYLLGNEDNEIELEADYFASCLLMPESIFRAVINRYEKKFSFGTLKYLSDYFQTSFLATILRFAEVGPMPVFFTFNNDGKVKWYKRGAFFPEWALKFRVHEDLPEGTLISELFEKRIMPTNEIREVDPDDWFYINSDEYASYTLYEQCCYLRGYDYLISMLWFGK